MDIVDGCDQHEGPLLSPDCRGGLFGREWGPGKGPNQPAMDLRSPVRHRNRYGQVGLPTDTGKCPAPRQVHQLGATTGW